MFLFLFLLFICLCVLVMQVKVIQYIANSPLNRFYRVQIISIFKVRNINIYTKTTTIEIWSRSRHRHEPTISMYCSLRLRRCLTILLLAFFQSYSYEHTADTCRILWFVSTKSSTGWKGFCVHERGRELYKSSNWINVAVKLRTENFISYLRNKRNIKNVTTSFERTINLYIDPNLKYVA